MPVDPNDVVTVEIGQRDDVTPEMETLFRALEVLFHASVSMMTVEQMLSVALSAVSRELRHHSGVSSAAFMLRVFADQQREIARWDVRRPGAWTGT